jgi:hypothetical protein
LFTFFGCQKQNSDEKAFALCVRLLWSLTQKNNEKWCKLKKKIYSECFLRKLFKSVGVGVCGILSDYC